MFFGTYSYQSGALREVRRQVVRLRSFVIWPGIAVVIRLAPVQYQG